MFSVCSQVFSCVRVFFVCFNVISCVFGDFQGISSDFCNKIVAEPFKYFQFFAGYSYFPRVVHMCFSCVRVCFCGDPHGWVNITAPGKMVPSSKKIERLSVIRKSGHCMCARLLDIARRGRYANFRSRSYISELVL